MTITTITTTIITPANVTNYTSFVKLPRNLINWMSSPPTSTPSIAAVAAPPTTTTTTTTLQLLSLQPLPWPLLYQNSTTTTTTITPTLQAEAHPAITLHSRSRWASLVMPVVCCNHLCVRTCAASWCLPCHVIWFYCLLPLQRVVVSVLWGLHLRVVGDSLANPVNWMERLRVCDEQKGTTVYKI